MSTAMAVDELPISFDEQALLRLCETYRIAELSFFGSVIRDDFNPLRSDVDVLVEFLPDTPVRTLFMDRYSWFALRRDLAALFQRKVDVVEKEGVDRYIKDDVIRGRVIIYQSSGNGGALVVPKRRGLGGGVSRGADADATETVSPKKDKSVHAFVEINRAAAKKAREIKKPDLYLFHMRDDCQYLLSTMAGLNYEDFVGNRDKQLVASKLLEQIGENAGKLSRSFRKNHPDIPWDSYIESRQHIAHVYEAVIMYTVWRTVQEEIPVLLAGLKTLITEVTDKAPKGEQK